MSDADEVVLRPGDEGLDDLFGGRGAGPARPPLRVVAGDDLADEFADDELFTGRISPPAGSPAALAASVQPAGGLGDPSDALAILQHPAVQQVLQFLSSSPTSLPVAALGPALDGLPLEDALGYLVQFSENAAQRDAALAAHGQLVDGTIGAKLAAVDFVVTRVLNLPVEQSQRSLDMARHQFDLRKLRETAQQLIDVAQNAAAKDVIVSRAGIDLATHEADANIVRSQAGVAVARNSAQQDVLRSDAELAALESGTRVAGQRRQHEEKRQLGTLSLQAQKDELTQELQAHDVQVTRAVVLPAEKRAASKLANLKAKRTLLTARRAEKSFFRERYGWIVVALVVLVVLSNIVADVPGQQHAPILSSINNLWDAIYMPVRNGVFHTYHSV